MSGDENMIVSKVLATALEEWNGHVQEPPGSGWERIDEYIRSSQGLGWTWENKYIKNRQLAWCGAFAAFCFGAAGLLPTLRKKRLASTTRLYLWARGTARMVDPDPQIIKPGDIVVVGPTKALSPFGSHITICESVNLFAGIIETIEGNAFGNGPDGSWYEGVIRRGRPFSAIRESEYRVRYGIRPLAEDYK
jgi:hypothetical protein